MSRRSALTFNYQFETVGDVQKKCLCGAPTCTGSLGGKQKKEEKISSAAEKVKKKKLKKKRKMVKKLEKVWEEVCFRCTETGNLLKCEFEDCPKAYHPLCVSLDRAPPSPWTCPWHFCATCNKPVTTLASGAWCQHCPNAYCTEHASVLTTSDRLGSLCNEHVDEIGFLEETVTNLAELLVNPHPTQQDLLNWRAARGAATTTTVTASDSNTDTESLVKPKRNRFSVEMDGNQSPWEREDSLSGGRVKEGEKESNHFESKQSLPCDLPVVKKELKEAKGSIKEKEESRSNSRRGRSPTRRSTAVRMSLDSSTEPSPLRRTPIKSSRTSPVKSHLADVSTTVDSVVMKSPQNEDSINLPETPSRRTRTQSSPLVHPL